MNKLVGGTTVELKACGRNSTALIILILISNLIHDFPISLPGRDGGGRAVADGRRLRRGGRETHLETRELAV